MKTEEILRNVEEHITEGESLKISKVYNELGIFDWWNETLSISQMKQMRSFLKTAIDFGYTGYACFKVGAAGCSHGMWAYKEESEDGYSPNYGGCIFHSFRSGDNYYSICNDDGIWMRDDENDCIKQMNAKQFKEAIKEEH